MIADSSKKCVVVLTNDSMVAWNDLVVIGKIYLIIKVTVVYYSRRLFVHKNGGVIISMCSGLINELCVGLRKESETALILLSGDENMCIVDTDSKIQEEGFWKVIKMHLSLI